MSKQSRGAAELELAVARFNAYGPLLRTQRTAEARTLLDACRAVYEKHSAYDSLAQCLSAMADLEDALGHGPQAVDLERVALRFKYLQPDPTLIAVSQWNLANYLARWAGDQEASLAHRLAATVLRALTASGAYRQNLRGFALALSSGTVPPAGFDALCAAVERVEGVRFRELVEGLGGDGDQLLAAMVEEAKAIPAEELYAELLDAWEPTLALLVAANGGNLHARAHLDYHLARRAQQRDWAQLGERLTRARDGEGDPTTLGEGLNDIDTAILTRALDALAGRTRLDPAPEPLRPLIAAVVAARRPIATGGLDDEDAAALDSALDQLAAIDDWTALAAQLRRLTRGSTEIEWDGLDATATAVLATILRHLEGPG